MTLTMPTPDMSQWEAHKRLIKIRKICNKHTLANAFDGKLDVENDPRFSDVARGLNVSFAALAYACAIEIYRSTTP